MACLSIKNKTISRSMLVGNTPYSPATLLAIATSTSSSAATSSDGGASWTARTMPSARNWYALWYANGRFVVAGNGSTVGAYSTNGITWTTTTLPSSSAWVQTGYGNSTWVIQGQNQPSAYAVSTDNGATWSSASGGSGYAGSSAVFGNGVFVSAETQANAGTNAWYSTNGTSWTNGGSLGATTGWGRGYYAASGGGFIIAANTSTNYVSQSTTGTGSWTLRTLPTTQNWYTCLAYGNGVWSYLIRSTTQAASSTDGITWVSRTGPSTAVWESMWYSAAVGKFIAVASGGTSVATSTTGTGSWTLSTLPSSADWVSISSDAQKLGDKMYYEIDETDFAVRVYDGKSVEPFWYQPQYPNGDKFDSIEEATAWAELAVKSHDPDYNFFPPDGKGLEGRAKPTPQEILEGKLASLGLTVDELKSLLA